MAHDIIDNRHEKLADHINTILQGTEKAKFAVGYFFLSGFEAIRDRLKDLKELRLLIGDPDDGLKQRRVPSGHRQVRLDFSRRNHYVFSGVRV